MIPNTATSTTSTPAPRATAPQAAAPGSQSAQPVPAPPAPQPTPVQLLWEVPTLAFELMRRLVHVLRPIQQYYPKQALLLARLLIDIPRIFLTLRYAPERVTTAQLRHLTRARHILQALFNYTLPLGARTSRPPHATGNQQPSASPNPPSSPTPGARKSSSATSATPAIRQVPEIPMVAGISHVPASPAVDNCRMPPAPSHTSPAPISLNLNLPLLAICNLQSAEALAKLEKYADFFVAGGGSKMKRMV